MSVSYFLEGELLAKLTVSLNTPMGGTLNSGYVTWITFYRAKQVA